MATSLNIYLDDIGRYKLLTAEEEVKLAKDIQAGKKAQEKLDRNARNKKTLDRLVAQGNQARQQMTQCNLRLVVSIAKKYQNRGVPLMDLIQEGNIGLIRAVERYDPTREAKFSTYAVWWIEQAICRCLAQDTPIRLPIHIAESVTKVKKVYQRLLLCNCHEPSAQEIAAEMRITEKQAAELLRFTAAPVSLDVETEEGTPMVEFIQDTRKGPQEEVIDKAVAQEIDSIFDNSLSEREKEIIQLRFGFYDGRPWSQPQIGEAYNISKQRVSEIERRAMEKLRSKRNLARFAAML